MKRLNALLALAVMLATFAAPARADSWTAGISDSGDEAFALTVNQDGSVFGQWCSTSTADCYWQAASTIRCTPGETYPVLISAEESFHAELVCAKSFKLQGETYWSYLFSEFKVIDRVARSERLIGIAVPLASGKFQVLRFNTQGAVEAMAKSHRNVERRRKTSTREQTL